MGIPLIYALHSYNLYGTERMALWTALGLKDEFDPIFLAPPGSVIEEASRLGFTVRTFSNSRELAMVMRPFVESSRKFVFLATGVVHSLACGMWNLLYRRELVHVHMVHGGADERLSYGRKRWLNQMNLVFVAVSDYVRERLLAHGVAASKIVVIENFLPNERIASAPKRGEFQDDGIRRVIVVSRVDPNKRVDLFLDALDQMPALNRLSVNIFGSGWDLDLLRQRAALRNPNVTFLGFDQEIGEELASSDLLVHLCPTEPFGLAILEAMAARVPVLVPDSGGAGSLVEDDVSGFRFCANDAQSLARRLSELACAPAGKLNSVVNGARMVLATRFSAATRLADYRRLLDGDCP